MIDPRNNKIRFPFEEGAHRQLNAIGRSPLYRVPEHLFADKIFSHLQRRTHGDRVTHGALLFVRRNDRYIAQGMERIRQSVNARRVNAVIV